MLLQNKAVQLLMAGDVERAIDAFRALIAARPVQVADDWFNLAYLLRCDRQFDAAIAHYDKALGLGAVGPEEIYLNKAAILSEHLNRTEDAISVLTDALSNKPDHIPALLNLATIYEDCGLGEKARDRYEQVLRQEPLNGRAHGRLTAIDVHENKIDQALARLNAAMTHSGASVDDRVEYHFAMGTVLDTLQRYDQAFHHFETGNRLAHARIPPNLAYDRQAMETRIERLIATFDKPLPVDASSPSEPDVLAPIFICGLFRSGSTLAERLIGRHSLITVGGEHETIPAMTDRLIDYPETMKTFSPLDIRTLRDRYASEIHAAFPNAISITDKRPDNFLHIGLIKTLFPDAKIIHTRRNRLDNLLSIYFLYFADSISYGFDLDDICHYMACHDQLMQHWKTLYGDDIITLDYDDLVRDPETALRPVMSGLDLSWEADCAATRNDHDAVKTASSWHVRKPINDRSSGRWHNYATHLQPLLTMMTEA